MQRRSSSTPPTLMLDLVLDGLLNKQIASRLGSTEATVKVHRSRLMRKLGAATLAGLLGIILPQRDRIDALIVRHARAPR